MAPVLFFWNRYLLVLERCKSLAERRSPSYLQGVDLCSPTALTTRETKIEDTQVKKSEKQRQ